jgi:hypothetical protein
LSADVRRYRSGECKRREAPRRGGATPETEGAEATGKAKDRFHGGLDEKCFRMGSAGLGRGEAFLEVK